MYIVRARNLLDARVIQPLGIFVRLPSTVVYRANGDTPMSFGECVNAIGVELVDVKLQCRDFLNRAKFALITGLKHAVVAHQCRTRYESTLTDA